MKKRALVLLAFLLPAAAAAQFDPAKPATGTPPVSADMRNNFTALQKTLNGVNLEPDPNFNVWPSGGSAAPAAATLSGAGAAVSRAGIAMGDTNRKFGNFSAKVVAGGGATATLDKDVLSTSTYDDGFDLLMITRGAWVKTSSASGARIGIFDGAGTTYSSYHTGGGAWEFLTVSRQVDAAATRITARFEVAAGVTAYESSAATYFGETPPGYATADLLPVSARGGNVWGAMAFKQRPTTTVGAATSPDAPISSELEANLTPVTIGATTSETDLMTYSVPANILNANKRGLRIRGWVQVQAASGAITLKAYWGATARQTFQTTAAPAAGTVVIFDIVVRRTGSNAQLWQSEARQQGTTEGNTRGHVAEASPTETDTSAITVKLTGTKVATGNTISQTSMFVEALQ